MSTATTPPQQEHRRQTDECDHPDCSSSYAIQDGVAGHCSQDCADRHRGHRFLNTLRFDHRYCATCFARLKDVHTPTDDWRERKQEPVEIALDQGGEFVDAGDGTLELDATACEYETTIDPDAVSGFQSFTSAGTIGEVREETADGLPDDTRQGTICAVCGNASLSMADDILRRGDIKAVARNLIAAARDVYAEGQTEHKLTRGVFVRVLREHHQQSGGLDFALAVGRALHARSGDCDD
ncbi:hypothetical protein [Halobacterium salinarum]|uniref:hypothetical protein n=1 Tax=Halobacterium salinarum TaxID=2242 RepID=UPI0025557E76|nr:hypothetical protein [Halobacterium salinarum]MDL0127090.1 hypothetical protein [Halobacterium salinarum]